ncbi:MAG: MBL fold metallo-hydrolase [Cyanophyceae cyanobacterium]
MAKVKARRPENVAGDLFVDSTCIDCDTCRWMAPEVFTRAGEQAAVHHQPDSPEARQRALQAMLSCPTASIGTVTKPQDIKEIQGTLPVELLPGVFHCGYHSRQSFGAASYLILREEGNILIDSPRFTPPLVKRLKELGGVRYLYLTHRDDVADHQKFHDRLGCDRILHEEDVTEKTVGVEIKLTGAEAVAIAPDFTIIPVPGHTEGHTVALHTTREGTKVLFAGDHLAWSPMLEHLYGFNRYCWYDWETQVKSMKRLAAYDFEWVLPGHERRYHGSVAETREQMQRCLRWMDSVS